MGGAAVFVAALIYVSISRAAAIKCLSCSSAARPRDCEYVQECGAHEKCSVQSILTAAGHIFYSVGCTDIHICAAFGKRRAILKATDLQEIQQNNAFGSFTDEQWHNGTKDAVLCVECCDTELCNVKGCGEEGWPADSGPVCYGCDQQRDPDSCSRIVSCGRDEACHLYSRIIGVDQVYRSGCLRRQSCQRLEIPNPGANVLIGRRQRGVDMLTSLKLASFCNKCCTGNLCNFGNCSALVHATNTFPPMTHPTTTPAVLIQDDGQWSSWRTWSPCSQTCGTGGTRYRHRTCDNPPPSVGGKDCAGSPYESQHCEGLVVPNVIQTTKNFTKQEGSYIAIQCLVPGSTPLQQNSNIQWFVPQTPGKQFPTNVFQKEDGSLVIIGLTVENTGPYYCQIITPCGIYNSARFFVNIQ